MVNGLAAGCPIFYSKIYGPWGFFSLRSCCRCPRFHTYLLFGLNIFYFINIQTNTYSTSLRNWNGSQMLIEFLSLFTICVVFPSLLLSSASFSFHCTLQNVSVSFLTMVRSSSYFTITV